MPEAQDIVFNGPIAELYDRLLVPLLFEGFAAELAKRAARLAPRDVLETAAGTGVVTRALEDSLAPNAQIMATDLNQAMLDIAADHLAGSGRVAFRQADAEALPFDDERFDLGICQFGVMFFPDKVKAHREMRRVLKPGGRYLFDVWGPLADSRLPSQAVDALAEVFPEDPPLFMQRTPHGYGDERRIRADLEAAGFSGIAIELRVMISRSPSARALGVTYCQATPLRTEIEMRRPGELAAVTEAVVKVLEERLGSGPLEGPISALLVEATA